MRCLIHAPAIAAGLLVTVFAWPVSADQPTPATHCPGGVCLGVQSPGSPGTTRQVSDTTGARAPTIVTCQYRPIPSAQAAELDRVSPHPGQRGGWFYHPCQGGDGRTIRQWQGPVWLAFPTPAPQPVIDPGALAQEAYRLLPIPDPALGVNPPADRPQLVNLPSWLWIQPSTWRARMATASVPGESVTARATPVRVDWSMGDGSTVVCRGPGSVYDARQAPAGQRSTCAHTYRHSSVGEPGGRFAVSATATWQVTWQATGLVPASGELPPLLRTSQLSLLVTEGQTLN